MAGQRTGSTIKLHLPDGGVRLLPYTWGICDTCRGHGTSSAYLGAFTAQEITEDPDFAQDYFDGRYDRRCEDCKGTGKVQDLDHDACTEEEIALFQEQEDEAHRSREISRQEYLMEGGWREEGWR